MSSVNVVRVKRKADEEPVEALIIALKKSKRENEERAGNEVFLKLATTFTSAADFNNDFLRNAITQDKLQKVQRRKSPKHIYADSSFSKRVQLLEAERNQKREQVLADRRLILALNISKDDESQNSEKAASQSTEVRDMFKLYDIIEENEESKSSEQDDGNECSQSAITCNGVQLIRMNGSRESMINYVYDVYYITDGNLDDRFVDGSVSVQPCPVNEELVYDSDEAEEYYDDDDDSNDECNWRNDYPDEDSDFEKDHDYENDENFDPESCAMLQKFKKFAIDEDKLSKAYAEYKVRVLEGLENEDDYED